MKTSRLVDAVYRDPTSTKEMTDYAYEIAHQDAVEQGYNPDTHPVVQALAHRALLLENAAQRSRLSEGLSTSVTPEATKKTTKRVDPRVQHIIDVSTEASGPIPHEEAPTGIPVIVDTKSNLVLSEREVRDRQSV